MGFFRIVFKEVNFLELIVQLADIDTSEIKPIFDPITEVIKDIFVVLCLLESVEEFLLLIEKSRLFDFSFLLLLLLLFLFLGKLLEDDFVRFEFGLHGLF